MNTEAELKYDVEEALKWSSELNAAHIGVSTQEGVVTLTGHVANWHEKWEAERIAKCLLDVRGIANEIEVDLPGAHVRSDTEIARAAVHALEWNAAIPDDTIKITVRDGCISLDGEVEWRHQREAAEDVIRRIKGVRRVANHTKITPRATLVNVKSQIAKAFERNARLDAANVEVTINRNKIVLRGTVRSLFEAEEAEDAAWSAPGVSEVDNRLVIAP